MKNEMIPLNIVIGDRNYRIRILPQDEEAVRNTLKTINDKIVEFRTLYAGKDMQDYVAMVLIWYATEIKENKSEINPRVIESLSKIESLLSDTLP